MPFSTDDQQQKVFDEVPVRLRSWSQSLDLPKMARWLSWNRTARQQIPEFWATKMLFEWHLEGAAKDPDDLSCKFDDLKKAATAKSSREELNLLKKSNGGIPLGFRLMSSVMLTCAKIIYVVELSMWSWYTYHGLPN